MDHTNAIIFFTLFISTLTIITVTGLIIELKSK